MTLNHVAIFYKFIEIKHKYEQKKNVKWKKKWWGAKTLTSIYLNIIDTLHWGTNRHNYSCMNFVHLSSFNAYNVQTYNGFAFATNFSLMKNYTTFTHHINYVPQLLLISIHKHYISDWHRLRLREYILVNSFFFFIATIHENDE